MDGIPSAEQALASSSGVEAPSRKLNAERACNSTYISRKSRTRTIFPAAHHKKSDKAPWIEQARRKKQFPGPSYLLARTCPSTSVLKCATARMHGLLFQSCLEKRRMPADFPALGPVQEAPGEKYAGQFAEPILLAVAPKLFADHVLRRAWRFQPRQRWKTFAFERHRVDAN